MASSSDPMALAHFLESDAGAMQAIRRWFVEIRVALGGGSLPEKFLLLTTQIPFIGLTNSFY